MFVLWRVNRVNPIMKQNLVASSQESVASNSPWQQVWFGRFLSKLLDESWARKRDRHGFFGGMGCNSLGKKIT